MGVLRARVGGQWVDIGGATDAVWVDPNAPTDPAMELWYDTDALSIVANPIVSGRNLLDNGQMAVRQRSNLSTVGLSGSSTFVADRWAVYDSGIGAANLIYSTATSFAQYPPAGRPRPATIQSIQMMTGEAAGSLAAGDMMQWVQSIEGQNLQHLNWGTVDALPLVYSVDVYSTVAATYVVELYRFETTPRSISRLLTVPAGFSTQIVTFPGDTSVSITNDAAARLALVFWQGVGSTYTSGTLQTAWGNTVTANRAVGVSNTFAATVGNAFVLTNAQLEVGTVPTPYEVRRYADELLRCMRYFERIDSTSNNLAIFGTGQNISTTRAIVPIPLKVRKRAIPVVAWSAANTFALFGAAASTVVLTSITVNQNTVDMITADCGSAASLAAGNATLLFANSVTTTTIDVNSEI